jgi:hypothetical protein
MLTTRNATIDDIWDAAQDINKNYPNYLDEVKIFLGR